MRTILRMLVAGALSLCAASASPSAAQDTALPPDRPVLGEAHRLFYNARYDEAAALILATRTASPEGLADDLALYELRSSALLFQLKRALDDRPDKEKAFKECAACPELLAAFMSDTTRGQALARERFRTQPTDNEALFFLGKFNLNYVWLHLGTLGRKTGWDQYWEARKSLDALLKRDPRHVRARIARAWIDYIVDTRMPRGTRWILGGGSKKRALLAVREAASTEADVFTHAEAEFAQWDMHLRERNMPEAIEVAQRLACDFPENPEIATFLKANVRSMSSSGDDRSLCSP